MEKVAHHPMIETKTAMMGLQAATSTKRKYEIGACGETGEVQANCSPAKASRWSTMQIESSTTTQSSTSSTESLTTTAVATATTTTTAVSTKQSNEKANNQLETQNHNNNSSSSNNNNGTAQVVGAVAAADAVATSPIVQTQTPIPSAEESIAKLEAVAAVEPFSAKCTMPLSPCSQWDPEPIVDSISRLQAVAVPDTWCSDSSRSALATTLLSADDLEEDDDDFEDDFDEDDSIIPSYSPLRYPCTTNMSRPGYMSGGSAYQKPNYYSEPYPQQNCSRTPYTQYGNRSLPMNHGYGWPQHSYYGSSMEMAGEQQTIRCAENGKSYLELGSSSYMNGDSRHPNHPKRCCDGRGGMWCNNNKQCYRERRLKMRNLSMFKLSRFRQISEQSLYRSVLICNTLKYIDREIEQENKEMASQQAEFNHLRLGSNNNNACNSNGSPRIFDICPREMNNGSQQQHHHPHQQQQHQQKKWSSESNGSELSKWIPEQLKKNGSDFNSRGANFNLFASDEQQQQQAQQSNLNVLQQQQQQQQSQNVAQSPQQHDLSHQNIHLQQHQKYQQPPPPPSDNSNSNNYLQPYNNRTPTPAPLASPVMSFESLPPYDHCSGIFCKNRQCSGIFCKNRQCNGTSPTKQSNDHPLRDCNGRATPFPNSSLPDTDSGYGDEEKPINWESVLSLSSQSALDPLNNNDLFSSTTSCTLASPSSTASSTPSITSLSSGSILTSQSSSITTSSSQFTGLTPAPPSVTSVTPSSWEYNLLDMDLGLTELLPLSGDFNMKSVAAPMEPTKIVLENEMDSLTHIMVGGS